MEVSRSIAHREECHREGDDNRHEEKLIPLAGGSDWILVPRAFYMFLLFLLWGTGYKGPSLTVLITLKMGELGMAQLWWSGCSRNLGLVIQIHQGGTRQGSTVTVLAVTPNPSVLREVAGRLWVLTTRELALELLEDGVLRRGLSAPSQGLRGGAGEHGGDVGHVFQAHPECAHQLLDEVECMGCDLGIGHGSALLKGH